MKKNKTPYIFFRALPCFLLLKRGEKQARGYGKRQKGDGGAPAPRLVNTEPEN
jgi:hypothetical protein